MIESFTLNNCAPIKNLSWSNISKNINVIIGENDTGKTLLLKTLYTTTKSLEEYKKGDNPKSFKEVLNEKLTWTFQLTKIGDLVTKGDKKNRFKLEARIDDENLSYSFSNSAEKGVGEITNESMIKKREANSIFIPAKEVLSLANIIEISRANHQFGFDDTYYDLIKYLKINPWKGNIAQNLIKAKKKLLGLTKNGYIDFKDEKWIFKRDKNIYPIHITAEGFKKISIIQRLINSRIIYEGAIIYIDEPETFLHPKAINEFMEMLYNISNQNIQIFLTTHSYSVLKKLYLIAKRENLDMPILSLNRDNTTISNLREDMPDNPIIDESIRLYEEELDI